MTSHKIELPLEDGMRIAHRFLENVEPIVGMQWFVVAGSIRRLKKIVHDVDIVFKPMRGPCQAELLAFCERAPNVEIHKWGPKLSAISYCGTPIDLYFSTPETFQTLLLIRTGSKENNIHLATIAKRKGWKLHASGEGLFNEKGERTAGDSERSIYDALGVPWQEPWERG
jgi:DNA polymerase (family 10)